MDSILKEYVREIITEKVSTGGFEYEKLIQNLLIKSGFSPRDAATAGKGHGADASFEIINSKGKKEKYNIEVKLSPSVFAGQKNCSYDFKTGKWAWLSQDELTNFYDELKLMDEFVLPYAEDKLKNLMLKFGVNKLPASLTTQEYFNLSKKLGETLELGKFDINPTAIYKHYALKDVHYIQIGGGYGFYYLDKDVAGLGVDNFKPERTRARIRLKWGGPSTLTDENEKKRSSLTLNVGIIFSGLKQSNYNLEVDTQFLNKYKSNDRIERKNLFKKKF